MCHPMSVIKRYRCIRVPAPCDQYAQLRQRVSKLFRPSNPRMAAVDFLIAHTTRSKTALISVWPVKSNRLLGFKVRSGSETIMVSIVSRHVYFIKTDTPLNRMTNSRNVFPISPFPVKFPHNVTVIVISITVP